MRKTALLALLLAVMMTLSSCALIQKDLDVDRATEIIRVGEHVFTKGEIQEEVNYQLNYMSYVYSMYGLSYDPTSAENIADMQTQVIDMLIQQAVLEDKAVELGMDQLTDEELAEATADADETWQSTRDDVKTNYLPDTELEGDELEAAIDEQMATLGIEYEDVLATAKQNYALQKLRDSIYATVTVTEEDLQAHLDEHIAQAQASYTSSPNSYGTAVNNGQTVYYRPAGYRMVKQILIQFNEDDQAVINSRSGELTTANNAASSQTTLLNNLGVENIDELVAQITVTLDPETGDVTETVSALPEDTELPEGAAEALTALAEARAQQTFFSAKVDEATATAFANIDAEADDVLAQLQDGADWATLAAEHNDDPGMQEGAPTAENGYAVCEGFTSFDSAFVTAAMAIPKPGMWSDKTAGSYGYYIIQYVSDVPEGAVTLDEVRDVVEADTLSEKQNEAYSAQVDAWVVEAGAQVDRKALEK